MTNHDMSNFSMLDLFRMEVEAQAIILNDNLLALEGNPNVSTELESLMRASHSIKGAARTVQLDAVVKIAHVMEDCFVAAQQGAIAIDSADQVDVLLQGVDMIERLSQLNESEVSNWIATNEGEIESLITPLCAIMTPNQETQEDGNEEGLTSSSLEPASTIPSPNSKPIIEDTQNIENDSVIKDTSLIFASQSTQVSSSTESAVEIQNLKLPDDENFSMLDLFRMEVIGQSAILKESLLERKNNPEVGYTKVQLEPLIKAAHTLSGASRIVQINAAFRVSHAIEHCFIAAKEGKSLVGSHIDNCLQGINVLLRIAQVPETDIENWSVQYQVEIETLVAAISTIPTQKTEDKETRGQENSKSQSVASRSREAKPWREATQSQNSKLEVSSSSSPASPTPPAPSSAITSSPKTPAATTTSTSTKDIAEIQKAKSADRVVRVSADNLNRIMGLAGESLVEANWLQPFASSLLRLKKTQIELSNLLEKLQESLVGENLNERAANSLSTSKAKANECRQILSDRLNELELFARRSGNLSDRLYREVIASNMRPFADGAQGFPRMMRDLARRLGKQVKFEIIGKSTPVDRDILEKLEAPLTHILRNSIDHGLESPEKRQAVGKPPEGTVRLEVAHRAGMLSITVSDDGRGIDLERLRQKIISKGMVSADMAEQLTEPELMEFLFLPGFSTAQAVTEVSGRGVGLDVVQSMVQEVRGIVRAISQFGKGMSFHLQLPLTLSVIRTLLVEISGEPYAFPLTRIDRIVMIHPASISVVENRQYFVLDEQNIGLVAAHEVLELPNSDVHSEELPCIIISDRLSRYALVVDKFLGERDLVVKPLVPSLGKVPDISAVALMDDGSPVLIVDVEDLLRSIDKLLSVGLISKINKMTGSGVTKPRKRILVVDDSITVREMERQLLENNGYEVEVTVDGMDGWNAVRTNSYDLVLSDIDMPRMNGLELTSRIKNHPNLKSVPVIIVSYKDRPEDRIRGLEVGANYYLTKSSFQDNSLINAVLDLIGESL
ncbi:hybrid sensor histidine kinase/response regulator [Nostoc favosum]|uniref:histidine kinase n=1 Tax=Nostoc favosum CHAB5714 TaxID=2780399 RepID=A0ABS8IDT1_9NOSO|nr:hybrid sensor histidine kinase/response regulator [Nostoc favosum]MCC5602220.1 hybrid sensor histidine kinase/response regulator [Nostoc favosum CHAB5714]